MVDFTSRQNSGPQSRALHYSYEKAGLVIDDQPIPWNADAVIVECQFRPPSSARRPQPSPARPMGYLKEDFTLRLAGTSQGIPAESVKQEDPDFSRVFFRFAVPLHSTNAEIHWRGQSRGQLQLAVFGAESFLRHFSLQMPAVNVQLDDETVQCQAAVTGQCRNIVLSALVSSGTSLVPIVDLGLRARMLSDKGDVCLDVPIHLSHSQLRSRQALLAVAMPRPGKTGEWLFQWLLDGKVLAEQKLRTMTLAALHRSLRISATRFVVQYTDGRLATVRVLPSLEGVERVGPCFLAASSLPGLTGWVDLEVRARPRQVQDQPKAISLCQQKILLSDGPTPILAGTLDLADFRQIKHFELRCRNRLVGVQPVEAVPTSSFTSEGGFEPTEDFAWSHAAEQQLQEKLRRLLGNK